MRRTSGIMMMMTEHHTQPSQDLWRELKRMKNNKSTGSDENPWRRGGSLWRLMWKIEQQMPEKWREMVLILVFKGRSECPRA